MSSANISRRNFVMMGDVLGASLAAGASLVGCAGGKSASLLADAAGTGDWVEGQRFSSGVSDDEVRAWARGI